MRYVSIDLETSGLDPERHDVLQIGCVVEDTSRMDVPVERLPSLNLFVVKDEYVGQPYALGMNAWILDIISGRTTLVVADTHLPDPRAPRFVEHKDVSHVLRSFFRENECNLGDGVFAAGKCFDSFDRPFLARYYRKFHRRVLDPMMMFTQPGDEKPPGLSECCERAGIMLDGDKFHDAVYDAQVVVELIRRGFAQRRPAVWEV